MEYVGSGPTNPEYLNGFSLVKSDFESPSQKRNYYLCLGRHDFFLVPCPADLSVDPTSTTIPVHEKRVLVVSYRAVTELLKNTDDLEVMTIGLARGTLKRMKHPAPVDPSIPESPKPTIAAINIFSGDRENLLTEFLVCLKASHMFFTFEIHTEELVRTLQNPKSLAASLALMDKASVASGASAATIKELEAVDRSWRPQGDRKRAAKNYIQGYSFYRPGEYDESQRSGSSKKQFDKAYVQKHEQLELGQVKTNVRVDAASLFVEQIEPSGEKLLSVQSLTERHVREICSHVSDWRLRGRPAFYQKKMNLTGDPASWTCWMMKIRTLKAKQHGASLDAQENRAYEFRHVTVIGCRRNFIPPTMQSHCDFLITHISQYQDFAEGEEEEEVAQLVCDTLGPQTSSFDRDDLVVQATADALLLDDPSYYWYESELRVRPRAHAKAREFCRALFDLLLATPVWTDNQKAQYQILVDDWERQYAVVGNRGGAMSGSYSTIASTSTTTTSLKPMTEAARSRRGRFADQGEEEKDDRGAISGGGFDTETASMRLSRIAEELELSAPGLDPETDANRADWAAWRIRVWRYLAYCADGVVFKDALNLELLTKAWKHHMTDKVVRQTIGRVLDKFIHLRQAGEEYKPDELHQKAGNERLMNSCAFNERVMVRLLKPANGYIQSVLSAHDMYLYPKFLVRLLCRNEDLANSAVGDAGNVNQSGTSGSESWFILGGAAHDSYDPSEQTSHAVLKCLVVQSSTAGKVTTGGGVEGSSSSGTGGRDMAAATAKMSASSVANEDKAHDIALNILVPALIRIFMSHPEDEKLKTFVIAILVNFSRNNYSVKANILAGGFAREIVKLLKSKDDDLVRHACSLLTNLTKTTDFRTTIYRGSTKSSLLDLIRRNPIATSITNLPSSDKYRSPKIISQACQVIGNLAIDPAIRADLLKEDELQHDADGNFTISTVVRILADVVCKDDFLDTFGSGAKERQEKDEVRASALFALKNLSISPTAGTSSSSTGTSGSSSGGPGAAAAAQSESSGGGLLRNRISTKSALGRYASKHFLKILKDKDVRDRNLIDYLLRLLYSLCYEPKVALKLQAEKIQDGLALRKQDFANLCLQIQTKIANQQKVTASASGGPAGSGGVLFGEDEAPEQKQQQQQSGGAQTVGLQGGILRQSRFGAVRG